MALLGIKDMDHSLADRLHSRATAHGRSVEQEALSIIEDALGNHPRNHGQRLLDTIEAEFGPLGGVDLDLPIRFANREPPRFDDF